MDPLDDTSRDIHERHDVTPEQAEATDALLASLAAPRPRRGLLKAAALGAGALAVGGGTLLGTLPALAAPATSAGDILNIAATAERLAVTFYSHGIARAHRLGISGDNLDYLKAAVTEEQIHQNFLVANGAKPLTSEFSFPHGDDTFEHKSLFISTLEQLEVDFIAAYLAAVKEFAQQGQPRLAQIAAQIMGVEAEHRTLGRDIGGLDPANNFGFEPALLGSVSAAVTALSKQGYLNPRRGNRYEYHPVSTSFPGLIYTHP